MSEKLTQSELFQMFGGEIPMEAVTLIFDSPGDMTIGELREKLKAMAEARKPKLVGEMVEIVAKSIMVAGQKREAEKLAQTHPHLTSIPTSWDDLYPENKAELLAVARSAIEGMRNPTSAMVAASVNNGDYGDPDEFHPALSTIGYQAMIDEALK